MAPTVFLALQCCQCSTMQVKQQKKSSNKWTCVVCNQKQSVRNVFAQGYMAKDVRKFVQSFNMSRQFVEQNVFSVDDENEILEIGDQIPCNRKQKRTDWTEYIDPEEASEKLDTDQNPGDDEFEPKIVTEIPKAVLKKPKLKGYRNTKDSTDAGESSRYCGAMIRGRQEEGSDDEGERKGEFADLEEEIKLKQPMCGMPKWNGRLTQNDIVKFDNEVPWRNQSVSAKVERSSKWNCYIMEEDGDLLLGNGKDLINQAYQWNNQDAFGTEVIDQKVEEDIHPDFQ